MKQRTVLRGSPVEYNTVCWIKKSFTLMISRCPQRTVAYLHIKRQNLFLSEPSNTLISCGTVYLYWDKERNQGQFAQVSVALRKLVTLWVEKETHRHPNSQNLDHCSPFPPLVISPSSKLSNTSAGNIYPTKIEKQISQCYGGLGFFQFSQSL